MYRMKNPAVLVVNCFRSLYLWVDLQPPTRRRHRLGGCELLSFFVPLGWFTALDLQHDTSSRLWIAFVLCTFGLIYSCCARIANLNSVVNCFRSLYLWVDLQLRLCSHQSIASCELLSFFVPLGWFTAMYLISVLTGMLWIAFVLCTFGLIYSLSLSDDTLPDVVNCFRSLYLWVDLQLISKKA